jgi:hypothetical protein
MSVLLVLLALPVFVVGVLLAFGTPGYRRFRASCKVAFADTFPHATGSPELKMGTSYGFPSFQVTFQTDIDLANARANGLTDRFTAQIQQLCRDRGFDDRPFDAEAAIWFTSQDTLPPGR